MATMTIGRSFWDLGEEEYTEEFYREQMAEFFRIVGNKTEVAFLLNGKFDFVGKSEDVWQEIECLPIKEGMNLVRFESGNVGFVAYYGRHVFTLEVETDNEKIAAYIRQAEEEEKEAWRV